MQQLTSSQVKKSIMKNRQQKVLMPSMALRYKRCTENISCVSLQLNQFFLKLGFLRGLMNARRRRRTKSGGTNLMSSAASRGPGGSREVLTLASADASEARSESPKSVPSKTRRPDTCSDLASASCSSETKKTLNFSS